MTAAVPPRTPVIIGTAQSIVRPSELPGPEPLVGWAEVVLRAFDDAHLSTTEIRSVDLLSVINCMSWRYSDPAAQLAQRLDAHPATLRYTEPGGTSGHDALHEAAASIRANEADLAVVVGGEAFATRRHFAKTGRQTPPWSPEGQQTNTVEQKKQRKHPDEAAVGFDQGAVRSFALRDVARRAHLGITPEQYRADNAMLFAGMTAVAAENPYAWFPEQHDAEFLATPRPDNRFIAYPYTKRLVAIMDVDLAAALVVTSEERANVLGVPREQRIYPWTGARLHDPTWIAVRPALWRSEAMAAAADAVLGAAGLEIDQVAHLDLYSCFPSSVNFTQDALGTHRPGDQITVTGGLPYAGGAGSSYMVNSVSSLVRRLRQDPGSFGLASGVGMWMTDHAFGIYSSQPPPELNPINEHDLQQDLDRRPTESVITGYHGPARVAAYTVMYDRDSQRIRGAAICDVPGGRAYAQITDPDTLAAAEETELVGAHLALHPGSLVGDLR